MTAVDGSDFERGLTAAEFFGNVGRGELMDDLYRAVVLIMDEVVMTRNPGSVNLTLKVSPAQGSDIAVVVSDEIKRVPPKNAPRESLYFAVGDGQVRRSDPRQTRFELRALDGGATELRVSEPPENTVREVGS